MRTFPNGGTLLASLLALAACAPAPAFPESRPSPLLRAPLPGFDRRSLDGIRVATGDVHGHPVVVEFFAKYCEPCRRMLPVTARVCAEHPSAVCIGIAEDESEADARDVVSAAGVRFPVVHDRGGVLAGRFRVNGLPATFVAARDGTVRWVGGAEPDGESLERALGAAEP